jgi:CHASE3 domain sensor protein
MSNKLNINLFHILVVAPLLIYLGLCKCKCCNDFIKKITLIFGITVLLYHSYEVYILMNKKKQEKYTEEVITSNNIV